ncbi:HAD family hydrolase [Carboxylicivirga linearis]|uniref:HAD-IIB family hydrolase n=1 Tax=Carboxylicivirga linearis TaxID=1628157 RepID=A0ABS5K100_9BACT|nr:HAD-IIB family hydrolase [Carboxylicivirga linearis]MBS2100807.1 HAD-IIB family hydrolase [Carboxylicivirga linearis]
MIRLLATDLDGTIHTQDNGYNIEDIEALGELGEQEVCRVIATGRTFQSALSVIPENFPIDYLVFSSGAGIYDWKKKELLKTVNLGYTDAHEVIDRLNQFNVEYTVHHPIPDNHIFFHKVSSDPHPDFERYIDFNQAHAIPEEKKLPDEDYSQVIAFISDLDLFDEIKAEFSGIKIIRATSPIDGQSIWMEFFHTDVSKAKGISFITQKLQIDDSEVVVIGNDYNDLDMLNHFQSAYIVNNAPDELKQQFILLNDVQLSPLADWYRRFRWQPI